MEEKDGREFKIGKFDKECESSLFAEGVGLREGRVLNTIVGFKVKYSFAAVFFTSVSLWKLCILLSDNRNYEEDWSVSYFLNTINHDSAKRQEIIMHDYVNKYLQ